MTINSKQKGSRTERLACQIFKKYGFEARRTQQYCGNTGDASDVVVKELPDFHIEVKGVERLNIYSALAQAERDTKNGKIPLVVHKRNRSPFYATLSLTDLLSLIKEHRDLI